MGTTDKKIERRMRAKRGIRKTVTGTSERPRLTVFRSNRHIYAQLIDDVAGTTVASASTHKVEDGGKPVDVAKAVGMALAEKAREKGIATAVFDRNGYRYHGRVQALADGAREGGLKL